VHRSGTGGATNRLAAGAAVLLFAAAPGGTALAQSPAVAPQTACAGCHGPNGRGEAATGAPNIGGMDAWYVERQLLAFLSGQRGGNPQDSHGSRMRAAIVSVVSPGQARAVADQIAALPRSAPPPAAPGADLGNGRNYYNAICSACHNSNGMGSSALGAPRLAGIDPVYLLRQLAAFRSGLRGAHPDDRYGAQMRRILTALPGPQTDRDVIAYVAALPAGPGQAAK